MGAEFTGLASLFSSILSVLNISELGFNTAIVYSLYRPMAEHNEESICNLVSLIKRIYTGVGTFVLGAGILLMPFLKYLIKGSYPDSINLYFIYFLYLINSAISYYLFIYKECLLIADQRQDIANNIRTVVGIIRYLAQLIVLLFWKNFYMYLFIAILGTVVTNMAIQYATKKRFPYFKQVKGKMRIPDALMTQVKGLMINRICDTCRNSFDSLIISGFIGLVATTIYGNYYYIYSSLYGSMLVICNAMGASVGNSIVQKSVHENYRDMLTFSAIYAWITGWCTACLLCLYQPFMMLWAGEDLLLPNGDMILFCVYFYVINMNNIRNQYIAGTGIWWKLKTSHIIEAIANLLLNFLLGKILGITGVILATIFTILVFNYLQRNRILFRHYFREQDVKVYQLEQFLYAALAFVACAVSLFICTRLNVSGISVLFARGGICIVVPNIILAAGFMASPRRRDIKAFLMKFLKN